MIYIYIEKYYNGYWIIKVINIFIGRMNINKNSVSIFV